MYIIMFPLLLVCALLAQQTLAFPSQHRANEKPLPGLLRAGRDSRSGSYKIPSAVQNGTSKAQFDISTPATTLNIESLFRLDAPQVDLINSSLFDWWYFDAVSETNPDDSLVVTFFSSSAEAFPFLTPNETSVLNVWLWASFANGAVFSNSVPATVATVTGADGAGTNSSGEWSSTGFSWAALTEDLYQYEIIISSEELQVEGRLTLTSVSSDSKSRADSLLTLPKSKYRVIYPVGFKRNGLHLRLRLILDGLILYPTPWVRST